MLGAWKRRNKALAVGEIVAREHLSNGVGRFSLRVAHRSAEVDLIARDGPFLVIVEVKTRTEPVQAGWHRMVSQAQQERLIRAARAFVGRHPERGEEVRFDVVAVLRNRYGHRILHTESAFYPLLRGR